MLHVESVELLDISLNDLNFATFLYTESTTSIIGDNWTFINGYSSGRYINVINSESIEISNMNAVDFSIQDDFINIQSFGGSVVFKNITIIDVVGSSDYAYGAFVTRLFYIAADETDIDGLYLSQLLKFGNCMLIDSAVNINNVTIRNFDNVDTYFYLMLTGVEKHATVSNVDISLSHVSGSCFVLSSYSELSSFTIDSINVNSVYGSTFIISSPPGYGATTLSNSNFYYIRLSYMFEMYGNKGDLTFENCSFSDVSQSPDSNNQGDKNYFFSGTSFDGSIYVISCTFTLMSSKFFS